MENARRGDYIQTFTGRKAYPLDLRPEEVCIEDIAQSLSNLCRFTGHSSDFYSVGQHSVLVSQFGSGRTGLWYLLHDAAEAYINDISRPLKRDVYVALEKGSKYSWPPNKLAHISDIEVKIMETVGVVLQLPSPGLVWWPDIKRADNIVFVTEIRDLMTANTDIWGKWIEDYEPLPARIEPLPPKEAKKAFLERYYELGGI